MQQIYFIKEDFKNWPKLMNVTSTPQQTALSFIHTIKSNGSTICFVDSNPTNNCQIFAIASFANALSQSNAKEIIKECLKCGENKRQLLVDIPRASVPKLKTLFSAGDIIFEQDYTSTNKSLMTIFLIKTACIGDWL